MSKLLLSHTIARIFPLLSAAMLVSLASCSDDEFDSLSSSRTIRFKVTATEAWSRSDNDSENVNAGSLSTVTLSADGQKLYLIPEVTAGIDNAAVGVKAASRAEATTNDNISDFGAYATIGNDSEGYYMDNVEVTKDNNWTPRKEYLWPGNGSLHINAYSPYRAVADTDQGITALPAGNTTDTPKIQYTVPDDVSKQLDLLWATPRDASASPCEMTFNHALAAVKFVTGAEMTPCTVKSITITGLLSYGTLDLENGAWTDTNGAENYTATVNTELTSPSGQEYVESGVAITDAANTFMLLPQKLGDNATVTIKIEYGGSEIEYTASLSGQTWSAGNTYTYHLSANPSIDRFVITVDSPITFNYTGGTSSIAVKSIHESMINGVLTTSEIPWIAEFVDADGNVIETPSWISSMPNAGDGSGDYTASTHMVEPTFVQMSQPTRYLRQQPEVGSASSPYNLSNSSGSATVENTANCYVVNAPGTYSIPLVYGNAIKNGADNTAAYAPTRSAAPFVNHLGNRIKHPYIYDNDGCGNPKEAILVWEGRLNMIHDLHLSADGKSIVFNIPRGYIRQGNAVVGVTDASGNIMWSWQLWVTDYVPGDNLSSMTYNGVNFEVMPYNMGYVVGGDETDFASSSALVRFTQKPADGSVGNSVTVKIEQTGKHIITPDCYSFYQWGRKDPMISGIKEWYYADHTEITKIDTRNPTMDGTRIGEDFDMQCVLHPEVFWVSGSGEPTFRYTNNWNLGSSSHRVKTVYDPCPPGFMVPGNEFMALRDLSADNFSYIQSGGISDPAGFDVTCSNGQKLFFPALGYRSGNSGNETVSDGTGGSLTAMWTSHANTREAGGLVLDNNNDKISHNIPSDPRLEAFAVRPIRE